MGIKRYKPTSSARRFMSVSTFEEITTNKPERSLLEDQRHTGGRNAQGNSELVVGLNGRTACRYRCFCSSRRSRKNAKACQYNQSRN